MEAALLRKYYGVDPAQLTMPQYIELAKQIGKIERILNPKTGVGTEDHLDWVQNKVRESDGR